ncbi:hypothetical protein D3C72_1254730 [compost metagenome]
MGRAEHPHIDPDFLVATHPTEAAIAQKTQQLGLQVRRHFPDFIEEHRALVGQFQQAELAAPLRTGEGAGGVAEQLALGQALRQCRAVQGQKRRIVPWADGVAGAGHQLLAGAGFALDQQRRIKGRHSLRTRLECANRR